MLFVRLGRGNAELRAALVRLIPTLVTGPALVMVAAFTDSPYRELLWLVGGLIDFSGPIISRMQGWKVLPSYFVERHGNIMIIALGESIVQVGVGAHGDATRPSLLVGVALGVLISAGLWWAYFGSIRPHAHGSCNAPEVCYKASWPVTPTATFTCRSSAASCTSLSESTRRLSALTSRSLC